MSYVYIAPLADDTAFKVGKAIAPSSRLTQLLRYYEFDTSRILIVNCKTVGNAFELESILHKSCSKKQKLMPYDGGTEFFSFDAYDKAITIVQSVCSINDYQTIPFVRQKREKPADEAGLIVDAFSNKIRARHLELNLTQAEVAKLANLSKRTIEHIENHGKSMFYNMVCVLRVLDLEYLFSELEITAPLRQRASQFESEDE
ncbi:MAG: GIY-YIG nuclease family protein [Proteobacteria bacterium]|nr:GIY-YIG nuclease family protein [Pseudomonadota bacterium]